MLLRILPFLLALTLTSCTGERVSVDLEHASIRSIPHSKLWPDSKEQRSARDVLQLNISSQTELLSYFRERDKQLQVRCSAHGNSNGRDYSGFAIGPVPELSGVTSPPFHYVIYSFIDLEADDTEYAQGKPASTVDLKSTPFESLTCTLVGVEKAPVPFLRSTDLVVSSKTFHQLVDAASGK